MSRATSSSATVPALSPWTESWESAVHRKDRFITGFRRWTTCWLRCGYGRCGARKQRFWLNSAATQTRSRWPSPPGWPCAASPAPPAPDARLLAAVRREDLVAATVDAALLTELAEINEPLRTGVAALARRLYGRVTKETIEWTTCAVIDCRRAPFAAI